MFLRCLSLQGSLFAKFALCAEQRSISPSSLDTKGLIAGYLTPGPVAVRELEDCTKENWELRFRKIFPQGDALVHEKVYFLFMLGLTPE